MNNSLAALPTHSNPINKQAALVLAKTNVDDLPPMSPEMKINKCKDIAKIIEKEYPPAIGRWAYCLNLAAIELGYKCYADMQAKLGMKITSRSGDERNERMRQIQELQFKVAMLETQLEELQVARLKDDVPE